MNEFVSRQLDLLPEPRGMDVLRRRSARGSRGNPSSPPPFPGDILRIGTPEDYHTPTLKELAVWENLAVGFNARIKAGNRSIPIRPFDILIHFEVPSMSQELFFASLDDSGWSVTKADYTERVAHPFCLFLL